MTNTIRHVGIVVEDQEESLIFWSDLLGFNVYADNLEQGSFIDCILDHTDTSVRTIKLKDAKNQSVELLHFQHPSTGSSKPNNLFTPGLTHIALQVSNIGEILSKLKNSGYNTLSEPQISPNKLAKVAFIIGPENLYLELVELN